MSDNVEIGRRIDADGIATNLHDVGTGPPIVLIHGSGPGVSAWANWRITLGALSDRFRLIAPDMVGFGYTERPEGAKYTLDGWLKHLVDVLDALGLDEVNVVGNSFGGALALALAIHRPDRVRRLVLMGSVGVPFRVTDALEHAWGYEPSLENMRRLLESFAYDKSIITDSLVQLRHEASLRPGVQESFSSMFPAPRQRAIDALSSPDEKIRAIRHETLIIHGRDDQIIPLETSQKLLELISRSQLHVFGRCGHWTQIEQAQRFNRLIAAFFEEDGGSAS